MDKAYVFNMIGSIIVIIGAVIFDFSLQLGELRGIMVRIILTYAAVIALIVNMGVAALLYFKRKKAIHYFYSGIMFPVLLFGIGYVVP